MNQNAYQKSIKLLAKKDYSHAKLTEKLLKFGFEELEIQETIQILVDKRFLNEDEYIRRKVLASLKRNYSNRYIIHKLESESLCISSEIINQVREEIKLTEHDQIKSLINKKLTLKNVDYQSLKIKISTYLCSKGFDYYDFCDLLDKAIDDIRNN